MTNPTNTAGEMGTLPGLEFSHEAAMHGYDHVAWQLEVIARIVESWIDWSANHWAAEGLTTEDGTAIMALPVPVWPTHGQLSAWVEVLRNAARRSTQGDAEHIKSGD